MFIRDKCHVYKDILGKRTGFQSPRILYLTSYWYQHMEHAEALESSELFDYSHNYYIQIRTYDLCA